MIEDIYTYGQMFLAAIGLASVALKVIAPFTKSQADDKALAHIEYFLKIFSLHQDDDKLTISIKKR